MSTFPGEPQLQGCVTEFDKVGADDVGPRWVSISALLTELADSLEHGTVFDGRWAPTVADGRLEWHYQQ